jgi:hypothetical protein
MTPLHTSNFTSYFRLYASYFFSRTGRTEDAEAHQRHFMITVVESGCQTIYAYAKYPVSHAEARSRGDMLMAPCNRGDMLMAPCNDAATTYFQLHFLLQTLRFLLFFSHRVRRGRRGNPTSFHDHGRGISTACHMICAGLCQIPSVSRGGTEPRRYVAGAM